MSSLSEKDLEDAVEYDTSFKMLVADTFPTRRERLVGVITDEDDTCIKLLALAGPPPGEMLARGISSFSQYVPWIREVSAGIRILFPNMKHKQVHEKVTLYADWCRQRRTK